MKDTQSSPVSRDALANAIDSPTVEALAKVFSVRNQNLAKSISEQIVDILAPRFPAVAATAQEPEAWCLVEEDGTFAFTQHHRVAEKWRAAGDIVRPLYRAPAQAAPMPPEMQTAISAWIDCPEGKRPSAAALGQRIADIASALSSQDRAGGAT